MHKFPFIVDIPADEYHEAARRGEFLSSHLLGDFRKSPRLYHKKMNGEIDPSESTALAVGRAVHVLVLEGRAKFDAEFMVSDGPVNPKTGEPFGKLTKAYREWAASLDKPVVSGPDFERVGASRRERTARRGRLRADGAHELLRRAVPDPHGLVPERLGRRARDRRPEDVRDA